MMINPPPKLPAGFNSTFISGDEFNGGGRADPVWPDYFSSSIQFAAILIDDDLMSLFDTERPDLVVKARHNVWTIAREKRTQTIKRMV